MTTYVINRSDAMLPVEIEFPDAPLHHKEYIFIQTKSKARLPPGSRVTPPFAALFASDLMISTVDGLDEPISLVSPNGQ